MTARVRPSRPKPQPLPPELVSLGVEYLLDFAPPGLRTPLVTLGIYADPDAARAEAEAREGEVLCWRGPDCSFRGWMAPALAGGFWLIAAQTAMPLVVAALARGRPRRELPDDERMEGART